METEKPEDELRVSVSASVEVVAQNLTTTASTRKGSPVPSQLPQASS